MSGRIDLVDLEVYVRRETDRAWGIADPDKPAPNSGNPFGWLGRLADNMDEAGTANFIVNIEDHQSLAVRARNHVPLVFDNPAKFARGAPSSARSSQPADSYGYF